DRLFQNVHPLAGAGLRLDPPRMTNQALARHRPLKAGMNRTIKTRRHLPAFPLRVPADWRLDQESIDLAQVSAIEMPRANEIANRKVQSGDFLALRRALGF